MTSMHSFLESGNYNRFRRNADMKPYLWVNFFCLLTIFLLKYFPISDIALKKQISESETDLWPNSVVNLQERPLLEALHQTSFWLGEVFFFSVDGAAVAAVNRILSARKESQVKFVFFCHGWSCGGVAKWEIFLP